MPGSCCGQPLATMIAIGDREVGLMGLRGALQNVYLEGTNDEQKIKRDLLRWIREFGNYVPPGQEEAYKKALFREYQLFQKAIAEATRERAAEGQYQPPKAPPTRK